MGRYVAVGGTIYLEFPTQTLAGAKATLSGTPVISAYKDDSLVQTTAGVTLTVDHDGITGCNVVKVDTSADGTFYSNGAQIRLRITTGTVDSINVAGDPVGEFTMGVANANVSSMANGSLTANAIASAALNGKGDWNTVVPDNTGIGVAAAAAASAASSAAAAASDTTSILAKIGGFAGSGLNTILGFLKSIMRSDASVPSDVGGTFASSTDSLEAQANAIAALGSLGSGAYSVAITVVDENGAPVPNAHVAMTAVGQTIRSGTTDGDGICPPFSSDGSIDWTVAITAGGGLTFTPVTLSVAAANVEIEYEMVASPLSQPDDPSLISHNVLCTGTNGLKEPGAIVYYRAIAGTGTAGYSRDTGEVSATADANGLATLTFIIGCTYAIRRGTIGREVTYVASATTPPETLGAP